MVIIMKQYRIIGVWKSDGKKAIGQWMDFDDTAIALMDAMANIINKLLDNWQIEYRERD